MKIIQLTPGSGDNFYCENCLRDNDLVKALRQQGQDALLVPLYLPGRMEETGCEQNLPIFFGGINVYLQQKFSLFRRSPRWLDRLWDARTLLNWAAGRVGMTRARDLGETTISILRGEEGRQVKELDRLVNWLASEAKPDIICLSNALLAGMARRLKEQLKAPVVCLLQDEDEFLDALEEPYRETAWQILRERVADVDLFIAVSNYYASVMGERLKLNAQKITVVYQGILLEGFEPAPSIPKIPAIGYLSRMCPDKGLDRLTEAYLLLKKHDQLRQTRLRIAGGKTRADDDFINRLRRQLIAGGVWDDVEFLESFERPMRQDFLRTLSVLCVPERRGESSGRYVLEALACGVPVVQPRSGVFTELLELTGGGILVSEAGDANELAQALEKLLLVPDQARALGIRGRKAVCEQFNVEGTARQLVEIFQNLT